MSTEKNNVSETTSTVTPTNFTPEQKWQYYFASFIEKLLTPKGYKKIRGYKGNVSNIEYLTQDLIMTGVRGAITVHDAYKKDIKAEIQLLIARERAKVIFDVTRGTRIKVLEEVLSLLDTTPPQNVKEIQR